MKVQKDGEHLAFFTLNSFNAWASTATGHFKTKYYKGLGISTPEEAREALANIDSKLIAFHGDEHCDASVDLAFDKKRADDRKRWLLERYDPSSSIDRGQRKCDVSDFVNLELCHFSTYDCTRSIPNALDGLKPSQRKILFVGPKHIVKTEMKVAQFASKVAELTDYHHGEQSLCGAIIGMAQTFVGSNNVNLLEPRGAFGSRLQAGQDAASPRYVFTQLAPIALQLFDNRDFSSLPHLYSDGVAIEPEYYVPVLPMVLVNGTCGIGTGFSSTVLAYNPNDLARYIIALLSNKEPSDLMPWYTGKIARTAPRKYLTIGIWEFDDRAKALRITEFPVGVWTDNYKNFCEKRLGAQLSVRRGRVRQHRHGCRLPPSFQVWIVRALQIYDR